MSISHGKVRPLVYNPTQYQKHLWDYHKLTNEPARVSENAGSEHYGAFPDFATEVFHRLYSEVENKLGTPMPGSDPFVKLHSEMDKIPEMVDFKKYCQGHEHRSGIGTSAVIDTLIDKVKHSNDKTEDPRNDIEIQKLLEGLLKQKTNQEEIKILQDMIADFDSKDNPQGIPVKLDKAKNASLMLDETEIRNAIRQAIKVAREQIDSEEKLYDGFSFGMDSNTGRNERAQVNKQLASIIGDSNRLKEIAKLAGRMRRIAQEQQRQKPQKGAGELTGITQGVSFDKLVPSEMFWASDEIEMVFAAKLNENSLLQFELNEPPKKEQGPIVILVDSSGSMTSENRDIWASAVGLAFLDIAYRQKRAIAFIHFGSTVKRVDIFDKWNNIDRAKVIESIAFFASSGGTNFEAPLSKGIEVIRQTGSFKEADIIMLTDGYSHVSDSFLTQWHKDKAELGFNCYSILLGSSTDQTLNEKFSDETTHLASALRDDKAMHKYFKFV